MEKNNQSFSGKTLIVYIIVAFGFSWLLWWPQALVAMGKLPESVEESWGWLFGYAAYGPLVGAFVAAWVGGRAAAIKDLLKRAISVRHNWKWYAMALFVFPVSIGGALKLATLLGNEWPANPMLDETVAGIVAGGAPQQVAIVMALAVGAVYLFFLGGPLQEEFGWRGTLQSRLQDRFNPLVASIITGTVWGFWHLPLFYMPREDMYYQRPLWGLVLSTILVSILITALYNRTGSSIFMALLMHTSFNWSHYAFPTLRSDPAGLLYFALLGLAAAWFIWRQRMWEKPSP